MKISFQWLGEVFDSLLESLSDRHYTSFEELDALQVRLEHRHLETVLDCRNRLIRQQRRVVAKFSEVSFVGLSLVSQDDRPPYYEVRLQTSKLGSIQVGGESDEVDASILGARLAKILGVPVHPHRSAPRTVLF